MLQNNEEKCIRVIHEINMEPSENLTDIDSQDFANETNYPEKYEEFSNVREYDEIDVFLLVLIANYR